MGPDLGALTDLVARGGVVVLSGAGISTESGIPDYRGPTSGARPPQPMTFQAFVGSAEARQRYWARSHLGWQRMTGARPNAAHVAVARLQHAGLLAGVITQNVDGLHQAAGTRDVIELHGALEHVVCLSCGDVSPRRVLHERLLAANPEWAATSDELRPDGDVRIEDAAVAAFRVVDCQQCAGVLKPDVVFFGENVPRERVQQCFALVESARALLVLGSSLAVMSGYRFVLRAAKHAIPVAVVNQGSTRGDGHAAVRIDGRLGEVLPALVERLSYEALLTEDMLKSATRTAGIRVQVK